MKQKIMLYGVSVMYLVIGTIISCYGLNEKSLLVTCCGYVICFMAGRDAMLNRHIKKSNDENMYLTHKNQKLECDLRLQKWKNDRI